MRGVGNSGVQRPHSEENRVAARFGVAISRAGELERDSGQLRKSESVTRDVRLL